MTIHAWDARTNGTTTVCGLSYGEAHGATSGTLPPSAYEIRDGRLRAVDCHACLAVAVASAEAAEEVALEVCWQIALASPSHDPSNNWATSRAIGTVNETAAWREHRVAAERARTAYELARARAAAARSALYAHSPEVSS